jgi:hypothetical protein
LTIKVLLKSGAKKRKRTRTPSEDLTEDDERRWAEEEERGAEKGC